MAQRRRRDCSQTDGESARDGRCPRSLPKVPKRLAPAKETTSSQQMDGVEAASRQRRDGAEAAQFCKYQAQVPGDHASSTSYLVLHVRPSSVLAACVHRSASLCSAIHLSIEAPIHGEGPPPRCVSDLLRFAAPLCPMQCMHRLVLPLPCSPCAMPL